MEAGPEKEKGKEQNGQKEQEEKLQGTQARTHQLKRNNK